jgi:MFS family permease
MPLTLKSQTGLSRFLSAYYGYVFLFDFIFCYAVYTALFELEGLNLVEIGILIAFWSASAVVLELPSGALSDWLDRRLLLVAAPLVKALCFVCWALAAGNFWLYGLGFLFWSAGQALHSGTCEALLYERLEAEDRASQYDRILGRAWAAEALGIAAGLLLGGFIAVTSMELSVWLSVPPLILAALLAIALPDTRRLAATARDEREPGYFENFGIAFAEFRALPALRFVTLYIAVGLILFEILEEFDQIYYLAVSLPVWLFGIVGAVGLAADALGSIHAWRLAHVRALAWLLPLIGGVLLVVSALGDSPAFVIVLELAYIVVVPAAVLAEARFQQLMQGRSRATTTSALVVAQNVSGVVLTLAFGALAEFVGILPAFGWAGFTMLPVAAWVFWHQRQGLSAIA